MLAKQFYITSLIIIINSLKYEIDTYVDECIDVIHNIACIKLLNSFYAMI